MSFLKRLFGNQKSTGNTELTRRFDDEFMKTLNRFKIVAGIESFQFRLLHPETKQPMTPHEGIAGTFEDWQKIQSLWDRRRLFFDLLLQMMGKSMTVWHVARILAANREPQQAIKILTDHPVSEKKPKEYAAYCAAWAIALLKYHQPADALEWAQKAIQIEPQNNHFRILLADAMAMTGDWQNANLIYTELMESASNIPTNASTDTSKMFEQMFALETGVVPSPVLAIEIVLRMQDAKQYQEFWQLGEAEFYDSPYFRMHHAYYYARQGDLPRALAKLVALVQELPTLKEANLNLVAIFEKLDPSGSKLMPEFQKQVRETIKAKGWTTDGMHAFLFTKPGQENQ